MLEPQPLSSDGKRVWNRNAVKCMIFKHKLDRATFMLSSDKSFVSPRQEIPRNVHQVDYVDEGSHRFWMMVGAWWIFNKFLTPNFHILFCHLHHSQGIYLASSARAEPAGHFLQRASRQEDRERESKRWRREKRRRRGRRKGSLGGTFEPLRPPCFTLCFVRYNYTEILRTIHERVASLKVQLSEGSHGQR